VSATKLIEILSGNYAGLAPMANAMGDWLSIAGVAKSDVDATVLSALRQLVLDNFDPLNASDLFNQLTTVPAWLTSIIDDDAWTGTLRALHKRQ
jgi:hypothetical protein